jgi:uncharacterized RDD family membrane protein YckC
MRYIDVGRRAAAQGIDAIICLLIIFPLGQTQVESGSVRFSIDGVPALVAALLGLGYFVLLEWTVGGTFGKLLLGIRVRRPDGTRIGFAAALVRNVARVVDALPYFIPYLVAAVAVSRSTTCRRLGDRWAGTVVIAAGSEEAAVAHARTPGGPITMADADLESSPPSGTGSLPGPPLVGGSPPLPPPPPGPAPRL